MKRIEKKMRTITDKTVITRKPHYCDACLRKFPKGTQMRVQVNLVDNEIDTWRECPTCRELLSKHREQFNPDEYDVVTEGCVRSILKKGQTPEDLLLILQS